MTTVLQIVSYIILVYFFLLNFFYLLFIILSMFGLSRYRQINMFINYKEIFMMPLVKPISIIAPVYNEEKSAIESIKSLLALEYPQYEVIVVNDGSTDKTLKKLIKAFKLKKTKWVFRKSIKTKPIKAIYKSLTNPKLIVVDKINGKKADAINAGLNISHYPLFCGIDGDSVLEKDALLKMVRPFLEDPEKTVAAGGVIRLSNGTEVKDGQVTSIKMPRNWFARLQILEYLRAFLGGRLGLSMLRSMLIVSGAFGLFRKDIVLKCGGYRAETIGEDMDLVVRMRKYLHEHKIPFRVAYIPDPICWTEAPETVRSLANQRIRWHKGLIESLLFSKKMIFNPRYGTTGIIAMPFYFIFEMVGPLIEVIGYTAFVILIILGELNRPFALSFFLLAIVFGILLSILSVLLGEYSSRSYHRMSYVFIITLFSFLENLAYRQFISIIRVKAFIDILRGNQEWGVMDKKGFSVAKQKS
jgi:cellulose synthase/poly-beta-1,6-N-acetylglucosamine synthase-like glycosyltransferase